MLRAKSSPLPFYGNHIYHRVIPKARFLDLPDKAPDLAYFPNNIPDCRIEEVNLQLTFKWFVGLPIEEPSPDSSVLTCFRDRALFLFPKLSGGKILPLNRQSWLTRAATSAGGLGLSSRLAEPLRKGS